MLRRSTFVASLSFCKPRSSNRPSPSDRFRKASQSVAKDFGNARHRHRAPAAAVGQGQLFRRPTLNCLGHAVPGPDRVAHHLLRTVDAGVDAWLGKVRDQRFVDIVGIDAAAGGEAEQAAEKRAVVPILDLVGQGRESGADRVIEGGGGNWDGPCGYAHIPVMDACQS